MPRLDAPKAFEPSKESFYTTSNSPIVSVEEDMWFTLFRFGIPPLFYLGPNTPVVKICQY
jgi:hypothetical protein